MYRLYIQCTYTTPTPLYTGVVSLWVDAGATSFVFVCLLYVVMTSLWGAWLVVIVCPYKISGHIRMNTDL